MDVFVNNWGALCTGLALILGASAPAQVINSRDLIKTNLEDLMNMEVTTVSKKEQKLSKAGAAVFVITRDDIRRSTADNVPDLLRMAPGVDIAQIDSNSWAISIRGFNNRYSNKVLVLIDGRAVYTPSFSGVFWDELDLPPEDIERIEVIRGPGGTVWGANAVNGVINIITRNAKATPGGLVSAAAGLDEDVQGLLQYGGKAGKKGAYRAFGRYFDVGRSSSPQGGDANDGLRMFHEGFRSDWDLSLRDTMTFQGDILQASERQNIMCREFSTLRLARSLTRS
jgi:iron complex outermembrane receptor protein